MSRVLLLVLFALWMVWRPQSATVATTDLPLRLALFTGGYVVIVGALAVWSRRLARRVVNDNLHQSVNRFNKVVESVRWVLPIWYAAGLYVLGWGDFMQLAFGPVEIGQPVMWMGLHLPTTILGLLPGLIAWMGMWWAQFPADQAMREQALMNQLDAGLPTIAPPRFRHYFAANFRMQILFICLPLLMIVAMRDLLAWAWVWQGYTLTENAEGGILLLSSALIFTFAPTILIRVLPTEPLSTPLRKRLEAMCRRSGLKYRDILLWRTNHNISNAAVMGLFPRVRYILLSDALIETMTDEQIEAVFAHEIGHVVHRHMTWYAIFFIIYLVGMACFQDLLPQPMSYAQQVILSMGGMAGCLFVFSFISRQCERQADVYAARLMEVRHRRITGETGELVLSPADLVAPLSPAIAGASLELLTAPAAPTSNAAALPVGRHGAAIFSSALHRVATVNNINIKRFEWLHGSIETRLHFLRDIAGHPRQTERFDRQMQRMYGLLLVGLFASLLWVGTSWLQEKGTGRVERSPSASDRTVYLLPAEAGRPPTAQEMHLIQIPLRASKNTHDSIAASRSCSLRDP